MDKPIPMADFQLQERVEKCKHCSEKLKSDIETIQRTTIKYDKDKDNKDIIRVVWICDRCDKIAEITDFILIPPVEEENA